MGAKGTAIERPLEVILEQRGPHVAQSRRKSSDLMARNRPPVKAYADVLVIACAVFAQPHQPRAVGDDHLTVTIFLAIAAIVKDNFENPRQTFELHIAWQMPHDATLRVLDAKVVANLVRHACGCT